MERMQPPANNPDRGKEVKKAVQKSTWEVAQERGKEKIDKSALFSNFRSLCEDTLALPTYAGMGVTHAVERVADTLLGLGKTLDYGFRVATNPLFKPFEVTFVKCKEVYGAVKDAREKLRGLGERSLQTVETQHKIDKNELTRQIMDLLGVRGEELIAHLEAVQSQINLEEAERHSQLRAERSRISNLRDFRGRIEPEVITPTPNQSSDGGLANAA